jgi:D-alanyl-lipoteichoic acid acyltransferase DltB (MBOAT superfamily)
VLSFSIFVVYRLLSSTYITVDNNRILNSLTTYNKLLILIYIGLRYLTTKIIKLLVNRREDLKAREVTSLVVEGAGAIIKPS